MKNLRFLLILILLVQLSCQEKNRENFTLTGKISNELFNGHYAYLAKMADDLESFINIDSVVINNNEFVFQGKAINDSLEGRYVFLGFQQRRSMFEPDLLFIPEGGNIQMIIDSAGFPTLSGTPENERLAKLLEINKEIFRKDEEQKLKSREKGELQTLSPEEMMTLAKQLNETLYPYLKSIAGTPLFDEIYVKNSMFLGIQQKKEFNEIWGKRILEKVKNDSIAFANIGKVVIGQPFYELECTDLNGKKVKLSDYVGKEKIILLDFWASWCAPCRAEFPLLKEIHSKYKDKGFDVINISVDEDENNWKKAIAEDQLTWTQLLSKQGKGSARTVYEINSIPHTILIDREGIIVAKNIRGEQIEEQVKKLIDNEKK